MKLPFKYIALILFLLYSLSLSSQSTFTKWINNIEGEERHRYVHEIIPGKYLFTIYHDNLNFPIPNYTFDEITMLYTIDDSGTIIDSLNIEKLDDYYIVVIGVIRSDNEEILIQCNALNENTLDIQLCLLRTDYSLNILSYDFYGSPYSIEFIQDFCINNANNIVFSGSSGYEAGTGGYILWEMDWQGNTINHFKNDTLSLLFPSIIQIPSTGMYHINDGGGWVLMHNEDLTYDTLFSLSNDLFFDWPQHHKLIDSFRYFKIGLMNVYNGSIPPQDPYDMALLILNNDYQIEDTFLFGTIDTLDFPGTVDFIDTNRIFFNGVKNYKTLPPEDSWLCLYITNMEGDTLQSRYYGGYGLYSTSSGLATSDGGYIIIASWFDFHNYIPPGPVDYDIFIMKVDENGLITNIPSHIPFEQTDILVYPNPGKDYLKIESSLKNLKLKLFDVSGGIVLERDFYSSSKINTEFLPSGNYIYQLSKQGKVIKSGKWVKH